MPIVQKNYEAQKPQTLISADKNQFMSAWLGGRTINKFGSLKSMDLPLNRLTKVRRLTGLLSQSQAEGNLSNGHININIFKDVSIVDQFTGLIHVQALSKQPTDEKIVGLWQEVEHQHLGEVKLSKKDKKEDFKVQGLKVFTLPLSMGAMVCIIDPKEMVLLTPLQNPIFGQIGSCFGSHIEMCDLIRKAAPELAIAIRIAEGRLILESKALTKVSEVPGFLRIVRPEGEKTQLTLTHELRI